MPIRRCVLGVLLAIGAGTMPAAAQKYPHTTLKMIVPVPPGGSLDALGRGISKKLEERLGVTIVIDNKPGAANMIGADALAKSPPDGATMMINSSSHVVNQLFTKNVPYHPTDDFAGVIRVGYIPLILVAHPGLPVSSVKDLIELARAKPGEINYASGGLGSGGHLSGELFNYLGKVKLVHVAYKGNAVALNDVLGGHVPLMFDTITTGLQHAQQGTLKMLAVTSATRSALAPDTPTIGETGLPGFDMYAWYVVLMPAKTPRDLVTRVNAEINNMFKDPAFSEPFTKQGVVFVGGPAEEADAFLRAETKRWIEVMTTTGIQPQ